METKSKKTVGSPTQQFLKLSEIRDDLIVMNDGTLRAVLAVSSTNFDLKSEEEQNALIYSYQRFLNSLEFHIQIVVQSRKMDIAEYMSKLNVLAEKQTNELLRMQTQEYIEFIDRLVESANVMNKDFYVIVPYNTSVNPASTGLFGKLFGTGQSKQVADREANIANGRKQLDERANTVAASLSSSGLRVVRLGTDQLIELVYNSYNFAAGPSIDASQLEKVTIKDLRN
ncbi:MAG TPA: TraC family protein [Candidatus Doudnabacteria bacterium]|nr:TraC family protein [Candidatus Doudnabacteria bacterium]